MSRTRSPSTGRPYGLARVGTGADPAWEEDPLIEQAAQRLPRRSGLFEGVKDETQHGLHLSIWVAVETAIGPIDQPDRRQEGQFPPSCLVEGVNRAGFVGGRFG